MKGIFSLCLLGFMACSLCANDIQIATVDLARLLNDYDKAKEAFGGLKLKEISFRKELEGMRLQGQRLAKEVETLRETSVNTALSSAEREQRRKQWESMMQEFQSFTMRYDETRVEKETELRVSLEKTNKQILDEVVSATRAVGDREGFNLVLNANRGNPSASEVLFSKGVPDLTEKVLKNLNSAKAQNLQPSQAPKP
ncbi:MAG TPA: OmpH family outer membrane protein [Candidatus Saccharimonadales bacterium]|nr:OmpH family outer membrane protein [Candidatus Saccharimonadales bacterium]